MKHYYFNPKTQDLTIFDTESKDLMVLERILGIESPEYVLGGSFRSIDFL